VRLYCVGQNPNADEGGPPDWWTAESSAPPASAPRTAGCTVGLGASPAPLALLALGLLALALSRRRA
jgi:MYXO-CTERM domain-containing protein